MADSDEEDTLASFGTPFEPLEEDAPRKKAIPVHEQIVTDSEGRRRFHGAFTGGFSAGYFNSVGTKEGWQPSTFVSSRSKKFEPKAQRPEDFMDDEDMGEFGIAPKRITTTEEFLSKEKEIQNRRKRMVANREFPGVISGDHVLEDLVLPVKMSVGVELLKKMGWKEGQGVGPRERKTKKKVYGCSLPSSLQTDVIEEEEDIFAVGLLFAPKDTEIFSFTPKDDKHGFGYRGLDPSTALFGREDILGINPVSRKSGRKGFFGEAFGVGAFEEDDGDIYAADHMTNYDMELTSDQSTGLHGWTGPPKENMRGGELSIFTVTAKPMDSMKSFPPPVVPRDFDGNHKFDNLISPYEASQEGKTLTAADRGEMLGEEPLPTPKKSVFEYMSKEDKERVMLSSKSLTPKPASTASVTSAYSSTPVSTPRKWSSNVHFGSSSFKPFTKDPAKQARYEEFLKARNTEQACDSSNDSGLTEWEREREREEFIRSAALYQPLSSTLAARFTSAKQKDDHTTVYEDVPAQEASDMSEQTKAAKMKMFGKLTRDTFEWHPNNVLCKRFNIPNPYPGSDVIGVPKVRRAKFSLGDFLAPQTEKPRAILASSELEKERLGSSAGQISSPEVSLKSSEPATSIPVETASNVVTNEAKTSSDKTKQDDTNEAPQRPPMDLFKAIFADSSEDESNENDNDDDEETAVPPNPTESKTTPSFQVAEQTNVDVSVSDMFADISETSRGVLAGGNGIETETTLHTDVQQQLESSDFQYGPTLPPGLRYGKASFSGHEKRSEHGSDGSSEHKSRTKEQTNSTKKRNSDLKTSRYSYEEKHSGKKIRSEDSQRNRHRKKDAVGKERTMRYSSESSDSDENNRSRHKHKRKEKKRSHRHKHTKKSKHHDEERNSDKKISENRSKQCAHDITVSNDKQILDKLKNLQNLKDGKRMKAIDFM